MSNCASLPSPDRVADPAVLPTVQPALAKAAHLIRNALASTGRSHADLAAAAGVARSKASGWAIGLNAISALHMVRIASTDKPLYRTLLREFAGLVNDEPHVALPPRERLCSLFQEMGQVAAEVNDALADGHVDSDEKTRIKREIARARKVLDQLELDMMSHK